LRRALRYRWAQALVLTGVSLLIGTCAVFGPWFARAVEQTVMTETLSGQRHAGSTRRFVSSDAQTARQPDPQTGRRADLELAEPGWSPQRVRHSPICRLPDVRGRCVGERLALLPSDGAGSDGCEGWWAGVGPGCSALAPHGEPCCVRERGLVGLPAAGPYADGLGCGQTCPTPRINSRRRGTYGFLTGVCGLCGFLTEWRVGVATRPAG
jgi:hypothetical protein